MCIYIYIQYIIYPPSSTALLLRCRSAAQRDLPASTPKPWKPSSRPHKIRAVGWSMDQWFLAEFEANRRGRKPEMR